MTEIALPTDGEVRIETRLVNESIWLNLNQLSEFIGKTTGAKYIAVIGTSHMIVTRLPDGRYSFTAKSNVPTALQETLSNVFAFLIKKSHKIIKPEVHAVVIITAKASGKSLHQWAIEVLDNAAHS